MVPTRAKRRGVGRKIIAAESPRLTRESCEVELSSCPRRTVELPPIGLQASAIPDASIARVRCAGEGCSARFSARCL